MAIIFVTRNTEYHLDGTICVGIRDRRTGAFAANHPALLQEVTYMLARYRGGWKKHAFSPRVGSALCFERVDVTTGAVRGVRQSTPAEEQFYQYQQALPGGATMVDVAIPALPSGGASIPRTAVDVQVEASPPTIRETRPEARADQTGKQPVHVVEGDVIDVDPSWLDAIG